MDDGERLRAGTGQGQDTCRAGGAWSLALGAPRSGRAVFKPLPATTAEMLAVQASFRKVPAFKGGTTTELAAHLRPALLHNAALVVWLGYKAVRRLVEIGLKAKAK